MRSFVAMPPSAILVGVIIGAAGIAYGILRRRKAVLLYLFIFLSFLSGIFRLSQVEHYASNLEFWYGKAIVFRGYVFKEPEAIASTQRIVFKVERLDGENVQSFLTLLTLRRYPVYELGDELELQGILEIPLNRGEFDYVSYLKKDEIFSTISFPLVEKTGSGRGNKLKLLLSKIKYKFEEKLDIALQEPHSALLKGLTLGERESLPSEFKESLSQTGTTHIVALSGYNITLLGRFFIISLLFLTVPFRISFWIATCAIMLFVILTGASPSVVRAGIMGILVLVAKREGRIYQMTNALAFAAAVMIFHDPKILRLDVAFQLSFLATLGLLYLAPYLEKKLERITYIIKKTLTKDEVLDPRFQKSIPSGDRGKSFLPLKLIFIETLSAQLAVLPLLIYTFGKISIVSPITNLLVLVAVPYAMTLGFLTGFLGFLWEPLSIVAGWFTWVLLAYQLWVIEFFAKLPFASAAVSWWMSTLIFLIYGLVLIKIAIKARNN